MLACSAPPPFLPTRRPSDFKAFGSLPDAIEALKQQQIKGVDHCLEDLAHLQRRLSLLTLFQELFPSQFHKACRRLSHTTLDECLTRTLPPFMTAISKQYFPADDFDYDYAMDCWPEIPIPAHNYDVESDFEDAPRAIRVAAFLVGCYSSSPSLEDLRTELPGIHLPECWNDPKHWCKRDTNLYSKLSANEPRHIRNFWLLFETLAHDTGSIFLDISYDSGGCEHDYQWDKATVESLHQQWIRTKTITRTNAATIRAFDRAPASWNTLFRCWADMCRFSRSE